MEPRKLYVPLSLSRLGQGGLLTVLAADVGGTKTNLACYRADGYRVELLCSGSYPSRDYSSFEEIIHRFLAENPGRDPRRICAGVAGPVLDGKVAITNLDWSLDIADIRKASGIGEVTLINDLEATSYGLAGLSSSDLFIIREGEAGLKGNMAVIAPGTGLGEAGLFWDGKAYHPFATEGGHTDFAPRHTQDLDLLQFLQEKVGVVSWEHVVSGMGIHHIYEFLRDTGQLEEPDLLKQKLARTQDPTALISEAAAQKEFEICRETMRIFVRFLAHESCNLVLKIKATGGLFLGGGIPPKIIPMLLEERFYTHYLNCDRMQDLVGSVPIQVILNDKTALVGAAYYGAYGPG